VKQFRGGLIFEAHRLVYHSTLGWRNITKRRRTHLLAKLGSPSTCFEQKRQGHARPFVGVFERSIFKKILSTLAINALRMAPITTPFRQNDPWNTLTKGLASGLHCVDGWPSFMQAKLQG